MTLKTELNRLAGTDRLEAQGAAQVWASAPGMDLVGCLNKKNGTSGMELLGVVNALAGLSGVGLDAAAAAIPSTPTGPAAVRAYGTPNGWVTNGVDATCVTPATTAVGDHLYVALACGGSATVPLNPPTGYSVFLPYTASGGTDTFGIIVYRKTAVSGDAGATVSATLVSGRWSMVAWAMTGAPATGTVTTAGSDTNATSFTIPAFTGGNGVGVAVTAVRYNVVTAGATAAISAPWTERVDGGGTSAAPRFAFWVGDLATTPGAVSSASGTFSDAARYCTAAIPFG